MSNPIIYFSLQNTFSSRGFQDFYSVKRKENVEIENIKKIAAMVMIIRLFSLFHTTTYTSDAKRAHCSRFARLLASLPLFARGVRGIASDGSARSSENFSPNEAFNNGKDYRKYF